MRRLSALLILCSCTASFDIKKESARYEAYVAGLPDLKPVAKTGRIKLMVRYVENPALPGLTAADRDRLYRGLETLTMRVYGYDLQILETQTSNLKDFFGTVSDRFVTPPIAFAAQSFLISYFAADRDKRIADVFTAFLKKSDQTAVRKYLGYLSSPEEGARIFLEKLNKIYAESDLNGKPLFDQKNGGDEICFSYGHWSSILQAEREVDFFLTNNGIIGADDGMPLYVLARGGVTSAFIENNAFRPYQGAGVLGMYPFLADTAYFNKNRGKLTSEEKIEAIKWLWLHELGHLLLKKKENYTFDDSVHRAPPDLRYYEWTKRVRQTKNHHTAKIPNLKKF